jgi:hypothetical protein
MPLTSAQREWITWGGSRGSACRPGPTQHTIGRQGRMQEDTRERGQDARVEVDAPQSRGSGRKSRGQPRGRRCPSRSHPGTRLREGEGTGWEGEGSEEGAGAEGRLLVCRRGSAAAEVAWGALRDFLDSGLGASKEGGLTLQVRGDRALREGAQPLGAVCEARRRAREVQCCCLDWGIMSGMGRARRQERSRCDTHRGRTTASRRRGSPACWSTGSNGEGGMRMSDGGPSWPSRGSASAL